MPQRLDNAGEACDSCVRMSFCCIFFSCGGGRDFQDLHHILNIYISKVLLSVVLICGVIFIFFIFGVVLNFEVVFIFGGILIIEIVFIFFLLKIANFPHMAAVAKSGVEFCQKSIDAIRCRHEIQISYISMDPPNPITTISVLGQTPNPPLPYMLIQYLNALLLSEHYMVITFVTRT